MGLLKGESFSEIKKNKIQVINGQNFQSTSSAQTINIH